MTYRHLPGQPEIGISGCKGLAGICGWYLQGCSLTLSHNSRMGFHTCNQHIHSSGTDSSPLARLPSEHSSSSSQCCVAVLNLLYDLHKLQKFRPHQFQLLHLNGRSVESLSVV